MVDSQSDRKGVFHHVVGGQNMVIVVNEKVLAPLLTDKVQNVNAM